MRTAQLTTASEWMLGTRRACPQLELRNPTVAKNVIVHAVVSLSTAPACPLDELWYSHLTLDTDRSLDGST